MVFDQFNLDPGRPMIRHRLDAVVITHETDQTVLAGDADRGTTTPKPTIV